jgi:DNA ligase-1
MLMNAFADVDLEKEVISTGPLESFYEMITAAANVPGKKDKIQQLNRFLNNEHKYEEELCNLLKYALSPYITFGVKKIPDPKPSLAWESGNEYNDVIELLDDLAARRLTGQSANDTIASLLCVLDQHASAALVACLTKDLRAGFSHSTVNKSKPGLIPVFQCQLAYSKMPDINDIDYPVLVEPKFDGVRVIAVKENGVVSLMSRSGIPFENFEDIRAALTERMKDDTVFDGEVVAKLKPGEIVSEAFSRLMKRARASRGKNIDAAPDIAYHVFDFISVQGWHSQKFEITNSVRSMTAGYMINTYFDGCDLVKMTDGHIVADAKALEKFYLEQVENGLEGIIIKDPEAYYTFKRSKAWLKLKPFDTLDLEIYGAVEGEGKYSGTLGALLAQTSYRTGILRTSIGSGFSDTERHELWERHLADELSKSLGSFRPGEAKLEGFIVEVKYQDVTKAQDQDDYSLRFPTFVGFRGSKPYIKD